jgi:hypothetical protein
MDLRKRRPAPPDPGPSDLPWPVEDERELWADICQHSFFWFCDIALGYGRPDFIWWTPRIHRPFCDWFEEHVKDWEASRAKGDRHSKNLMVIVHREFGKTMIITKAGQLWLHLRDLNLSSYIGSSTVTRAQLFFSPLKALLMDSDPGAWFSWLYGNWYDPSRTWTGFELVHAARKNLARTEPSMGTWGIETGLVGMHPDVGFMDDPVDYEKMGSDASWLGKVNSHMHSLAPVFKADSFFVYTGTRYHDADPIGENLRNAGVASLTGMPMAGTNIRENGKWHVYFRAARDENGKPTYPENWPERRLSEYEQANPLQYAAQLMNNPNSGHHVPVTADQIDQLWVERQHVPRNLKVSVHIDTAFKSKESSARGDESVIQVWGHDRGTGDVYYLEGHGSNRWRIEDFNGQLVMILQKLKSQKRWPFILTDEAEVGGKYGAWQLTIQSWCHSVGLPAPHIELLQRGGRKKVVRLIEAASYWVDGHVKLVKGAPGVDKLIDQMLRIGTSANDDWADCGADVFNKMVYVPMHRRGSDSMDVPPRRPWDLELQDGDSRARADYDRIWAAEPSGERGAIE